MKASSAQGVPFQMNPARRGVFMSILNTSVSGMMADSNWLSSISQNVANANTTGYKNSQTNFSALVDQVSSGTAAGEGVRASTISLNSLQGSVASSQTATNLAVQGSGFFVVSDAAGDLYLTRDGSFVADASGNLVNGDGYYLMANAVDGQTTTPPLNSLSSLQKVNVDAAGLTAKPTTSGSLTANLPSSSASIASSQLPSTNTSNSTYTDETSLVVYDNLGGSHTINLYFANEGNGTWEVDAFDATKAASGGGFPYSSGPLATQTLTFGSTGALASGSPVTFTVPGGQSMGLDLSNVTQLAASFSVSAATADGSAPASLKGVSIATDGTLSFNYSNGVSVAAYDIPLANVASPDNLSSVNGNAYTSSAASGPIYLGTAGQAGLGSIESSSLESSTVDIATELTDMIQAQSAYQANSKAFQTGANILDVLNNLKP
jgi:flagellar hook protein FlgE